MGVRSDFQEFTGVDGSSQDDSGTSFNISGEVDVTEAITVSAGGSHVWAGVPLAENFIMNPLWAYPEGGIEPVTAENLYMAAEAFLGPVGLDGRVFTTSIDNARKPTCAGGPALTSDVESDGFELVRCTTGRTGSYAWRLRTSTRRSTARRRTPTTGSI